jgi:hypothetical protein
MKKALVAVLGLAMILGVVSGASALQTAPALGANGMDLRGTVTYGFKDGAPIMFNGEFVYGVMDMVDVRGILGYYSQKGGGSGKLSYGIGAKWAFMAETDSMPAMALDVSYQMSKVSVLGFEGDVSWLPINLIASKNLGGWDLFGTAGFTIPKEGDGWIALSVGVSYPLMEKMSILGAVSYDLVKDFNYLSASAGLNYKI